MGWLPLALLSAFCIASADALTRKYLQGYRARELVIVRFAMPGLLLLPLLAIQPMPELSIEFWYWAAALVPLEVLAMLLYVQAIRDTSLTLTLPYLSFTPVFNTITGYVLLGETVTLAGFCGIMLVVLGAWLLNIEHARGERFDVFAPHFGGKEQILLGAVVVAKITTGHAEVDVTVDQRQLNVYDAVKQVFRKAGVGCHVHEELLKAAQRPGAFKQNKAKVGRDEIVVPFFFDGFCNDRSRFFGLPGLFKSGQDLRNVVSIDLDGIPAKCLEFSLISLQVMFVHGRIGLT